MTTFSPIPIWVSDWFSASAKAESVASIKLALVWRGATFVVIISVWNLIDFIDGFGCDWRLVIDLRLEIRRVEEDVSLFSFLGAVMWNWLCLRLTEMAFMIIGSAIGI